MSCSPLCKLSDEQVVELAKSGDDEAYNHIIARYRNLVYSKAKAFYISGADREDLVQEGMIGLYKAVRDYDPKLSSFAAFAKLCVTRMILSAVKNSARNKHLPLNKYVSIDFCRDDQDEKAAFDIADDNSKNPENILIDKESISGISYRINQILSEMELKVLICYLDGMSYTDIAKKIEKEPKAVDNAVQRIRKKLGKILEM